MDLWAEFQIASDVTAIIHSLATYPGDCYDEAA